MRLNDAASMARNAMNAHGLVLWEFGFDRRRKRTGACVFPCPRHPHGRITLSQYFVLANPTYDVMRTLLHEIAHALTGPGHGHDAVWQGRCAAIGGDLRVRAEGDAIPGRWRAACECGRRYARRHRPPPGYDYFCRNCDKPLVWLAGY